MGSGDQAVPFPISFRTTFNCTSATNGAGTYENSGFAEKEYEKSRVLYGIDMEGVLDVLL